MLDRIFADITDSKDNETHMGGAKVDLSKCFDRCSWERCTYIMEAMGMSHDIMRTIGSFYDQL